MLLSTPAEALLAISAQDFDKRLEALMILVGTAESLANILLDQPRLLLMDIDDDIQNKVSLLFLGSTIS